MIDTKIKNMLTAGESETVEFKLSFDREAIETLVAFANTSGGKVFIGVSDKGEIKGTEVGKETLFSPFYDWRIGYQHYRTRQVSDQCH